jgi:hypothetical protein
VTLSGIGGKLALGPWSGAGDLPRGLQEGLAFFVGQDGQRGIVVAYGLEEKRGLCDAL